MENIEEFKSEYAEVFDVEPEDLTDAFSFDVETPEDWDSLAILSTIALVDQHFNVTFEPEDFTHCKNFGELIALIKTKQ